MAGIQKIIASALPELRTFLQNVLDESVLHQGFGCDALILAALRQARVEMRGGPYRSAA
jgi:hypothetical protein